MEFKKAQENAFNIGMRDVQRIQIINIVNSGAFCKISLHIFLDL